MLVAMTGSKDATVDPIVQALVLPEPLDVDAKTGGAGGVLISFVVQVLVAVVSQRMRVLSDETTYLVVVVA